MKTLKNKNIAHANNVMILPIIGETQLDENASFETDNEEAVDIMLNRMSDWEDISEVSEEAGEGDISLLTLKELIDLAVEAEYPEEEYAKFSKNKKLMVAYITKKAE